MQARARVPMSSEINGKRHEDEDDATDDLFPERNAVRVKSANMFWLPHAAFVSAISNGGAALGYVPGNLARNYSGLSRVTSLRV